jgi:hypothetical protein
MRAYSKIVLMILLILGCKEKKISIIRNEIPRNDTSVYVEMNIINTLSYQKICIKVINNSKNNIYIPDIRFISKNLKAIEFKGGKQVDRTSDLSKSILNLIDIHDTTGCSSFKDMIIDTFINEYEKKNLIEKIYGNTNLITNDSIFCIKKKIDLILLMKPKQIYTEKYLFILESLYADSMKIYFEHPLISDNLCGCHCDSLKIKYFNKINDFNFYTGKILSDTIYINYR